MPPEASSRPEMGLKRTETSTSVYGPPGATSTSKALFTARWTSTRWPLGAPLHLFDGPLAVNRLPALECGGSKSKRSTAAIVGHLQLGGLGHDDSAGRGLRRARITTRLRTDDQRQSADIPVWWFDAAACAAPLPSCLSGRPQRPARSRRSDGAITPSEPVTRALGPPVRRARPAAVPGL